MGGHQSSTASLSLDEAKSRLKLAKHILTYAKLERDVRLTSLLCSRSFIDPRTHRRMDFSISTTLSNVELVLPMVWRANNAVTITVEWVPVVHTDILSECKDDSALTVSRSLTVNDFYALCIYLQSQRELMAQAQQRLRKLTHAHTHTGGDSGNDNDSDDKLCSICLHREVDSVLECAHSFCSDCLCQWRQSQELAECPLCREELSIDNTDDWNMAGDSVEELREQIDAVSVFANQLAISKGRILQRAVIPVAAPAAAPLESRSQSGT